MKQLKRNITDNFLVNFLSLFRKKRYINSVPGWLIIVNISTRSKKKSYPMNQSKTSEKKPPKLSGHKLFVGGLIPTCEEGKIFQQIMLKSI